MKRVRWQYIISLVGLVSLSCAYFLFWMRMFQDPILYTGTDFVTFYTVGRIGSELGLEHVYKLSEQHRVQEELVGFSIDVSAVLPHNHIPLLNPLLGFLFEISKGDFLLSMVIWNVLMLALTVLSIIILLKSSSDLINHSMLIFLSLLYFFPIFVSILLGQDTALLLLGVSLWIFGIRKENAHVSGLGLALTTFRPHIALILAVPFLFAPHKAGKWFLVYASLMVLLSIIPLGLGGIADFFTILDYTTTRFEAKDMANFMGIFARTFSAGPKLTCVMGWGGYLSAITGACIFWKKTTTIKPEYAGIILIVSLFFVPHLFYHDFSLLLIPLLLVIEALAQHKKLTVTHLSALFFGLSILFMLGYSSPSIQFLLPHLSMILLIIILIRRARDFGFDNIIDYKNADKLYF